MKTEESDLKDLPLFIRRCLYICTDFKDQMVMSMKRKLDRLILTKDRSLSLLVKGSSSMDQPVIEGLNLLLELSELVFGRLSRFVLLLNDGF